MSSKFSFICVFAIISALTINAEITFKNVELHGYSMFTHKFKIVIESAATLKESLPQNKAFDKIELKGDIPILYANSITNCDVDEILLNHNKITAIEPGTFKNVSFLRKLEIRGNTINKIQEEVFNNLNIATLDLSNNSIKTIAAGAFDNMPELLNINLADNLISIWNNKWFAGTPLLTRISMQNNLIKKIPAHAFVNLKGEKNFGSVSLTINIILSKNKINNIDKTAFDGLTNINNLWLDFNEIDEWKENTLSDTLVNDLRIDNNKIKCITGNLNKIFAAKTTHLDGNPWECECLKDIELWAIENKKNLQMHYSRVLCDAEILERKIKNLNERLKQIKA